MVEEEVSLTVDSGTKKRLSPTVYYLLTGLALSLPGMFGTRTTLLQWQQQEALTPSSLSVIHLVVLGSMLTIACGVLFQLVPIAFQAPMVPRHVLYWHLPSHVLGVLLMVWGFLHYDFLSVGIGGSIIVCAGTAFFVEVLKSYVKARNHTAVFKGLVWPMLGFFGVVIVGLIQAFAPSLINARTLITHVIFGGLVFWGGLVIVITYKLIPMFALSHGYRAWPRVTWSLFFGGLGVLVLAQWLPWSGVSPVLRAIAMLSVFLGIVMHMIDMFKIVRARKRRRIVIPVYTALGALFVSFIGLTGILVYGFFSRSHVNYAFIYLFWFGGLIPLMFAFMQKMVPFLWFEYRYSKRPERKTAPLIDDMVPRRWSSLAMVLYGIGVLFGFTVLLFRAGSRADLFQGFADISAVLICIGTLILFFSLRYVLTIGGRRPDEEPSTS